MDPFRVSSALRAGPPLHGQPRSLCLEKAREMESGAAHDTVLCLASKEAQRIRRFRDADEEETDRLARELPRTPLLHITPSPGRASGAKWMVTSSGECGHPNEERMGFLREWVGARVLGTNRDSEGDPSGTFRIELHDSYSYLPRAQEYRDVLSFGRGAAPSASCARVALFPDPYQASGFGPGACMLGPRDKIPWADKRPTVVFAGSTTGCRDAVNNARIRACVWALGHRDLTDFRISAVVQMSPHEACSRVPLLREVLAPHLSPQAHFAHKFIANIVGNTACWSRVPMVLRSNSVLLHLTHVDTAWYYPEMHAGKHYVACDSHEEILVQRRACLADDAMCARITACANEFVDRFLSVQAAEAYAGRLLYDVSGK